MTAPAFDRTWLRSSHFSGFIALRSMPKGCAVAPTLPGVYVVTRTAAAPQFLDRSVGGHFKGKDPTVAIDLLQDKWIDGSETLYIGQSKNIRRRLDEFARFGRGEPVAHRGGRYLWQLADHDSLQICWLADDGPSARECELIDAFVSSFGTLPFANLNRPRLAKV